MVGKLGSKVIQNYPLVCMATNKSSVLKFFFIYLLEIAPFILKIIKDINLLWRKLPEITSMFQYIYISRSNFPHSLFKSLLFLRYRWDKCLCLGTGNSQHKCLMKL